MSRFQIISDVHTEFHRDGGITFCENVPVLANTLVIAGDFCVHSHMVRNISILAKRFENVIYVHGNHEYYNTPRGDVNNTMAKLMKRFPNFHWLNNSSVEIDGQRFIGATMWFRDEVDNIFYKDLMNDFTAIPAFNKWVYEENRKTQKFFEEEMKAGDVVITHHAPCELSVSKYYKGAPTNRFYICDQSKLIREKKPSFWIHGHIHEAVSYPLYDTWVESNPFGYIGLERTVAISEYYKLLGE